MCARDNLTVDKITRHTYICSKHFPAGEILNIKANPTLEPYNARYPKPKERRKIKKYAKKGLPVEQGDLLPVRVREAPQVEQGARGRDQVPARAMVELQLAVGAARQRFEHDALEEKKRRLE